MMMMFIIYTNINFILLFYLCTHIMYRPIAYEVMLRVE